MAVIDVFSYNGETEMLRLHIGALYKHVDHFFVVEAKHTFTGTEKPLYYLHDKADVREWSKKITHFVVNENDPDLWDMAKKSPNTVGAEHWKREFVQKEGIKEALRYLDPEDTVYIGDVDEIWDPAYSPKQRLEKLKLRVYAYYMDNRSSEEFWGTLTGKWKDIKPHCLNHLRSNTFLRNADLSGWHFTSQGGYAAFKRKLENSYTSEDYFTPSIRQDLAQRHFQGIDFLGRDFKFNLDESEWPRYLFLNRKEYAHLCKGVSRFTKPKRRSSKVPETEHHDSSIRYE